MKRHLSVSLDDFEDSSWKSENEIRIHPGTRKARNEGKISVFFSLTTNREFRAGAKAPIVLQVLSSARCVQHFARLTQFFGSSDGDGKFSLSLSLSLSWRLSGCIIPEGVTREQNIHRFPDFLQRNDNTICFHVATSGFQCDLCSMAVEGESTVSLI